MLNQAVAHALWAVACVGMLRMLYQVVTGKCTVELLHVVLSCDMY